ncbi:MAG: hypothetical protein RIR26_364 [Pseudomonadota bacterium]|jgi:hypothetical protein
MKKILLATLISLLGACGTSADRSNTEVSSLGGSNCVFDSQDPFEPHTRLPKGDHAGECYDTRKARSLVRLNEEQARQYGGTASGIVSVANVSHKGKFYVAHIPLKSVKTAIFHLEYFPAVVPAGHTQLRLQFDERMPVTLVSQSKSSMTQVVKVTDLVLSVEAIAQPGFSYDLFKGMDDQFGAVYKMTTLEDKYDHMVRKQNHRVEQWKLNMSVEEMQTILEKYVSKSQERGMNLMYHTLKLNCTTEIIAAIDDGMNYSLRERLGKFTAKTTDFYPNVIRISLIKRGLLPLGHGNDLDELANDPVAASFK